MSDSVLFFKSLCVKNGGSTIQSPGPDPRGSYRHRPLVQIPPVWTPTAEQSWFFQTAPQQRPRRRD